MTGELVDVGVELVSALVKLIMEAVAARDPARLRRVTDVLEAGHPLKGRVALLEARAEAERKLGR